VPTLLARSLSIVRRPSLTGLEKAAPLGSRRLRRNVLNAVSKGRIGNVLAYVPNWGIKTVQSSPGCEK
jgi:hypothetical protein